MKQHMVFFILILVMIIGILFFYLTGKPENIPTFLVSCIALFFSHYAYLFSKERFRLDLLEKRWEVYKPILTFCSIVLQYGRIPKPSDDEEACKKVHEAAEKAFRGEGYHLTKSLFDSDIQDLMQTLNKAYAHLSTTAISEKPSKEQLMLDNDYLELLLKTVKELPILFKPYMYFGDYRNDEFSCQNKTSPLAGEEMKT